MRTNEGSVGTPKSGEIRSWNHGSARWKLADGRRKQAVAGGGDWQHSAEWAQPCPARASHRLSPSESGGDVLAVRGFPASGSHCVIADLVGKGGTFARSQFQIGLKRKSIARPCRLESTMVLFFVRQFKDRRLWQRSGVCATTPGSACKN
jgi:hypothetical protein